MSFNKLSFNYQILHKGLTNLRYRILFPSQLLVKNSCKLSKTHLDQEQILKIYTISSDPQCILCTKVSNFATLYYPLFEKEPYLMSTQITPLELKALIAQAADFFLLDVRNPTEHAAFNIGGQLIPMGELSFRLDEIPREKPIIVYCRSGHRSQIALEFLQQAGYKDIRNLVGGLLAW